MKPKFHYREPARGSVQHFVRSSFLQWRVSSSPNLQAGGSLLVGCPRLLI